MTDAWYFGARPKAGVSRILSEAGYKIVPSRYTKGMFSDVPGCASVVLHWKSKKGQEIIAEAKACGLPVLAITSKLVDALQAGNAKADLYLEQPVSDEEVSTLLIEMIQTKQVKLVTAATNGK
jgi:hypothetical protein